MNPRFLALLIFLFLFFSSILIFALIYNSYKSETVGPFSNSFSSALYLSVTVQTSVGMAYSPEIYISEIKNWVILQSIIGYLFSISIILILVKTLLQKDTKSIELENIQKEFTQIKRMISKPSKRK